MQSRVQQNQSQNKSNNIGPSAQTISSEVEKEEKPYVPINFKDNLETILKNDDNPIDHQIYEIYANAIERLES